MDNTTFTLRIFDRNEREEFRNHGLRGDLAVKAAACRPRLGATYLTVADRVLKFKPYRRTDPFATERRYYHGPGTRRLSNKQIEAAARRFEADGEYDNAMNMLALRR